MCGINGCTLGDQATIERMNDAIGHRGPDDRGTAVDAAIALGHLRLSILDLSPRGHQPMVSPSGRYLMVYNGEIYNFRSVRTRLEQAGETFLSDSDTEVVLHAFERDGVECLTEFNGIFAFGMHDRVEQKLYLVRDRLGIKPLYYLRQGEHLFFSSEIKPFEQIPGITLTVDHAAVADYRGGQDIVREGFYHEVVAVPPGSWVEVDLASGQLTTTPYVRLTDAIHPDRYRRMAIASEASLVQELDVLLNAVVRDQLVSDAPIGTICSGGVDSSLITAIARQYHPDLQVYNVRVGDARCDESPHAVAVAKHLGLTLHQVTLDRESYLRHYRDCVIAEDLPLMHPNSVGIFLLSQQARSQGLSVLLSGEGADELFGGYHRYKAYKKKMLVEAIPLAKQLLGSSHDLFTQDDVRRFDFTAGIAADAPAWLRHRYQSTKTFLDAFGFIPSARERELKAFIAKDLVDYLPSILRRTDRMSMAVGLEMRVPYLDDRLIEFGLNLPTRHQVSFRDVKRLLKAVARRYLPASIVDRPKMGFPLPIQAWLGTDDIRGTYLQAWEQSRTARG
ncbi:MAG: asparagine synthase (glutamine-hydrolyzing) [Gemmatimonadales bacterium]|nr:asparagine synthase (glutamine-hydrolyzing) [Gemmatimonadales bacterium]MBP6570068.1 asparagine synthase (glutamine-hydrolyzing) [Gemmatimonadales bacterium]MBP7621693.1 asparagine synthase (glutamine-hydrolyzing) [Gemmatimonadales bacterium]MBP9898565.1 asparagine synthase (glutamine-hydrolyzing) [Gemmatimonadales bacterium]